MGAAHKFELTSNGSTTTLTQSETFSGLLVPLVSSIVQDTERAFELMNNALKKKVQGG